MPTRGWTVTRKRAVLVDGEPSRVREPVFGVVAGRARHLSAAADRPASKNNAVPVPPARSRGSALAGRRRWKGEQEGDCGGTRRREDRRLLPHRFDLRRARGPRSDPLVSRAYCGSPERGRRADVQRRASAPDGLASNDDTSSSSRIRCSKSANETSRIGSDGSGLRSIGSHAPPERVEREFAELHVRRNTNGTHFVARPHLVRGRRAE
jgi:hypothetical protein